VSVEVFRAEQAYQLLVASHEPETVLVLLLCFKGWAICRLSSGGVIAASLARSHRTFSLARANDVRCRQSFWARSWLPHKDRRCRTAPLQCTRAFGARFDGHSRRDNGIRNGRGGRCVVMILRVIAVLLASAFAEGRAQSLSGRVVGVADGDTTDVLHDDRAVRVRLHGIDCPERSQAFGLQARQYSRSLSSAGQEPFT
jgi:hypothetical protein